MQLGKVKPTATIVAQFAAGVEVEAIQHEGKIYLPAIHLGEFSGNEAPAPRKGEPALATKPAAPAAAAAPAKAKQYTKDELMEMPSKDLEKILRKEFNINPDDYDGKNTNKKLRDLILDAQKNGGTEAAPAAAEETEEADNSEATKKVAEILGNFDSGKFSRKKAIAAIAEACGTDDTDAVSEQLDKFEEDGDASAEDFAETIVAALLGEGGGSDEEPEGESVEAGDLEVGDKVAVWWNDDNQAWYTGVVDSVKRGKVHVKYDDGTDDVIDPEIHTEIKRLA